MLLIIGGAFQGKKEFVREKLQPEGLWLDGAELSLFVGELPEGIAVVSGLHLLIARLLKEELDPQDFLTELIRKNPDICLISNELGYGVVPIEAFDRRWREQTGRICTRLAASADHVYRVVCGIGCCIK